MRAASGLSPLQVQRNHSGCLSEPTEGIFRALSGMGGYLRPSEPTEGNGDVVVRGYAGGCG